jgi:plastocyanin
MRMLRFRSSLVALATSVALAGCGGTTATVAPATALKTTDTQAVAAQASASVQPTAVATNAVSIQGFDFHPAVITVPMGTTVTWTNKDVEQHTVTARDKSFNSDAINNDQTFAYAFAKTGSFDYFCQIHPHMVGTVVVTDK